MGMAKLYGAKEVSSFGCGGGSSTDAVAEDR